MSQSVTNLFPTDVNPPIEETTIEKKTEYRHKVFVDDNYHYMDQSERYPVGSYDSLKEAISKCEELTIESIRSLHEKGITAEDLHAQWLMFGDDPYITGGNGGIPFSARKFVSTELCKEIIDSIETA